jgi:hypothetical protein
MYSFKKIEINYHQPTPLIICYFIETSIKVCWQHQCPEVKTSVPNIMSMVCERGWGGQAADSDWSVRSPTPFGMAFGRLKLIVTSAVKDAHCTCLRRLFLFIVLYVQSLL